MSSEASAALFEASGWPRGLCQVIRQVWGCQRRFICWQGHVHPVPLRAAPCVPQGCPWSCCYGGVVSRVPGLVAARIFRELAAVGVRFFQ